MNCSMMAFLMVLAGIQPLGAEVSSWGLAGVTVTPHVQSDVMRYRRELDSSLGARVQLFLRNTGESDLRLQPNLAVRLRVDADGVTPLPYTATANVVQIRDRCGPVNLFVASPRPGLAAELEARRRGLVEFEESFGFDPGRRAEDLEPLRRIGTPTGTE